MELATVRQYRSKLFAGTEADDKADKAAAKQIPSKSKKPTKSKAKVVAKPEKQKTVNKTKKPKVDHAAEMANVPSSTVTLKTNVAPSVEIATELQAAFDHFNSRLFQGHLEPVIFSNCRLKKTHGHFWAKAWTRRKDLKGKVHEIGLDFARLHGERDKDVLATLVHEMVHEQVHMSGHGPKRVYHCKYWVAGMERIGLSPIIFDTKGQPTGKKTGVNSTHEIVKGGPFDIACDELLKSGFKLSWANEPMPEDEKKPKGKKKAGGKFKYEADCGAAFWGKPGISATCQCGCGSPFEQIDKESDDEAE